ncbi:MAG: T9SS type A sorting domain-containing protein, partial [Bacteroidales bacterium]|nr:T9SS type A sorting domain-containing protein [Bacteroidales bacterium]
SIQDKESIRIDVQLNPCPVSIWESSKPNIKIYPNPIKDHLFILFENTNESTFIEIYSVDGKKIYTSEIFESSQLDLNHLAKGFYYLNIKQQQHSVVYKIIKQ